MVRRILLAFVFVAFLAAASSHGQRAAGKLSGVVTASDGTPQAKARVYLQPGNGRPPRTVQTDAAGHYTFAKIRPGLYDMRAQANGHWSEIHRNVNVRANKEASVDLQLKPPDPPKPKNP